MLLLGEIADKMSTIPWLWIEHLVLAFLVSFIVVWHRWLAIAAIPACAWWIWAMYEMAYLDMSIADLIQIELGQAWITNLLVSSALPLAFAGSIAIYKYTQHRRKSKTLRLGAFA